MKLTNPLIAWPAEFIDALNRSASVEELNAILRNKSSIRNGDNVAMAVHSEVMSEDFNPSRRGRRPMVKVEPLVDEVQEARGRWVKFEISDAREANSVLRQFAKYYDLETSSETREDGGKNVYARFIPGR